MSLSCIFFVTMFALAALQYTKRLLGWSREQAGQASAIVTLQQQGVIPALVARLKCGLRCHCYNIPYKSDFVKRCE